MEFFELSDAALSLFFSSGVNYTKAYPYALITGVLVFVLVYVFKAMGLYTIARREGYANRWMAFIPFLNTYYIGVLAGKNKIRNVAAKRFSLIQAILEAVLVVSYIVYFAALYCLLYGGYVAPEYVQSPSVYGGTYLTYNGLAVVDGVIIPSNLYWATWMLSDFCYYMLRVVEIAYVLIDVMVLIAFFQTYSSRRYILLSLFSALFPPVKGILIFVVRNNKGKNYMEFVREQREKQYRMYQEYNRQNMNGNTYNYNPYTNRTYTPPQDDPYSQPKSSGAPEDPFAEFGEGSSQDDGDPFEDLKH